MACIERKYKLPKKCVTQGTEVGAGLLRVGTEDAEGRTPPGFCIDVQIKGLREKGFVSV